MKLEDLLIALQQRAPWQSVGRPMLLLAGFTIRRGYEKTIAAALKESTNAQRISSLESALTEHAVAGEKVVQLVKLSSAERQQVEGWIAGKRRSAVDLARPFPALAGSNVVRASVQAAPASLGSVDLESGSAALFTSSRTYLDRVELSPASLGVGASQDIEKLVAIKRVHRQTFDAVWIPARGNVACLVADQPADAPAAFSDLSLASLRAHLRQVLSRAVEPANLWPAVSGLYRSADGRLVDYGFATDRESVKHHKARRGAQCLRESTYDKAGAVAVGDDLLPFKVAMQWTLDRGDELRVTPELLLPGVAALLLKSNARLEHAIVRHCLSSRDLEFIVSKLLPHSR